MEGFLYPVPKVKLDRELCGDADSLCPMPLAHATPDTR